MKNIAKIIGVVVVVLVALLLLGGAAMMTVGRFGLMGRGIARGFGMMGRGIVPFGSPFGFAFGPFRFLIMLFVFALVLGAVVAFILWVVRSERVVRSTVPAAAANAPMEILRERYARGELTKEQFDLMKHDLETA